MLKLRSGGEGQIILADKMEQSKEGRRYCMLKVIRSVKIKYLLVNSKIPIKQMNAKLPQSE